MGGAPAGRWQQQSLGLLFLGNGRKNRRLHRRLSHNALHRRGEGIAVYFNQIVQRRSAADATGEPAPLPVGDFQTVVGAGAVGAAAERCKLVRLIVIAGRLSDRKSPGYVAQ